jgi:hypothetical protein
MDVSDKHYKFINSGTGYVIFYTSLSKALTESELKAELDKIKAQVAIKNGLYQGYVYWEEIKDQ